MTPRGRRGTTVAVALAVLTLATAHPASATPLEPWWYTALKVDQAHQQSTGKGVKIAVIDGAINMDAPELKGAKVTLRKGNSDVIDRLFDAKSYPRALYAGHGTAMTTLIVGQGTGNAAGGAGITGIAPDAEVLFYQTDHDPTDPQTDDSSRLFDQAIKDKVDIISYSFGGAIQLEPQLEAAAEAGIVVVASAGAPNGGVEEPASIPGTVAVGAAGKDAQPWSKQPDGFLTVMAPGVDIQSGIMRGTPDDARWVSGVARTGTSDATPLVAGALALVKSKYPESTGNQLIQQMIHSTGGRDYGYGRGSGFGVINLEEMLRRTPAGWPDENPLLKGSTYAYKTYPQSAWKDPAASAASPPAQDEDKTSATTTGDSSSASPLPWVAGGAVALLAAVGAVIVVRRRSQHGTDITSTGGRTHGTQ